MADRMLLFGFGVNDDSNDGTGGELGLRTRQIMKKVRDTRDRAGKNDLRKQEKVKAKRKQRVG